jgi:lysozyme
VTQANKTVERSAGVSAAALALACGLIASFEGEVRIPYIDSLGKGKPLTVCYGSTINVVPTRTYTAEECQQMLYRDARSHAHEVQAYLPANLPDQTAAAFYDFGYNVGTTTFARSSIVRKAQAGDLVGACNAISLYTYTNGKDCRIAANRCSGIVRRRNAEVSLCLKGLGQ